ncbi:MAG: HD domain-containing protein [Deltaproteobacteria bacterium]|nr:HD domain-containing protein [Deltaproteobacteria bacterium]
MPNDAFKLRRRPISDREKTDIRPVWAIDVDRILHSKAYTRYIDKTQVFYFLKNDHITHRVLHVQLVSRIARTIGGHMGLDLDLIEAMALGHDLGHPPFGHDGEKFLSELCRKAGLGRFSHAVMSVRFLERLEKGGLGLNLTLGVLDGILCHDGESDYASLTPMGPATFAEFDRRLALRSLNPSALVSPMTREGCVVRLADSISYVGRDLEDAVELGIISRADLPADISRILGSTNGTIVYRLVEDLLRHSAGDPAKVAFSPEMAQALLHLKNFNRKHIYYNARIKQQTPKIQKLYEILFETLVNDFHRGPELEPARLFLERLDRDYRQEFSPEEMARDFMAGMTDEYFIHLVEGLLLPQWNFDFFK